MVARGVRKIHFSADSLSYREAANIERSIIHGGMHATVVLDLARTDDATTAGLAKLISLRSALRRQGGDLHLLHLHGKARRIYEINRMKALLPCEAETAACPDSL